MKDILELRSTLHPAAPGFKVRAFRDPASACAHMCNHLLSAPECEAWASFEPRFADVVNLEDWRSRRSFAREAKATDGASAQELYNIFCDVITREVRDAIQLGWYAMADGVTVALGTSGVLTLFEGRCLRTAFLPGQSTPAAVRESQGCAYWERTLPREGGSVSGVRQRENKSKSIEEKETRWIPEKQLYYRVFRPAVQFIRGCHYHPGNVEEGLPASHYGLLKNSLPSMKALSFQNWLKMRHGFRGEHRNAS